jgi:hypothetical protein
VLAASRLTHRPDDGGSKQLRNVGKLLPDYTAQQPRRQPSSFVIYLFNAVFSTAKIVLDRMEVLKRMIKR